MSRLVDPIDALLEEHVVILRQADELEQTMARLEEAGAAGLAAGRETLEAFAEMLAGRLALHALKEDEALFPAVEAKIGKIGPTAVMREEHRLIHQSGEEYRALLKELHEVDHPRLERESEAYQEMVGGMADGSAPDLESMQERVRQLLSLMRDHFAKEEQILFPMTRQILDEAALSNVVRQMRELEGRE